MTRVFFLLPGVIAVVACGDGSSPACQDLDQDGHGQGCQQGPDCDDFNAARTDNCDTVPVPDCEADPTATGCVCTTGHVADCYQGPEGTVGVGECAAGRTLCINRRYGLCEAQLQPTSERCDGVDQDCDGRIDNGVQSPCGDCEPGCNGGVWGESDIPFRATDTLSLTALGELTLAHREQITEPFVWVANSAEGTVSKIDALEFEEVARYRTGDEPSRVAVDHNGDAWIANRQFDGISSLSKIAGDRDRCIDVDGDGLETSSGPGDVLALGEDECVLFRVDVGELGGVARALALDGDRGLDGASGGNAWVGLHDGEAVWMVDGLSGEVRERVETPGFQPYAAAFDPWGVLWLASRDGYLARIDRSVQPLEAEILEAPLPCYLFYSMAADGEGDLYLTGFSCDDVAVFRPASRRWGKIDVPPSPRGIGLLGQRLWVAHTDGRVSRLAPRPLRLLDTFELHNEQAAPLDSIGVGVLPGLEQVWVASGSGAEGGRGVATAVDGDGQVLAHVPVGQSPHTQGDLTGGELTTVFEPEGSLSQRFAGCPEQGTTRWRRVHLVANGGAAGTVRVDLRHASDAAALDRTTWEALADFPGQPPPYELELPEGGIVELRLTLRTAARDGAPRVGRVGIEWDCPGPI